MGGQFDFGRANRLDSGDRGRWSGLFKAALVGLSLAAGAHAARAAAAADAFAGFRKRSRVPDGWRLCNRFGSRYSLY